MTVCSLLCCRWNVTTDHLYVIREGATDGTWGNWEGWWAASWSVQPSSPGFLLSLHSKQDQRSSRTFSPWTLMWKWQLFRSSLKSVSRLSAPPFSEIGDQNMLFLLRLWAEHSSQIFTVTTAMASMVKTGTCWRDCFWLWLTTLDSLKNMSCSAASETD